MLWLDPVIGPTTRGSLSLAMQRPDEWNATKCPRRCGDCHETLEGTVTSHESSTLLVQPLTLSRSVLVGVWWWFDDIMLSFASLQKGCFPARRMEGLAPETCIMTEDTGWPSAVHCSPGTLSWLPPHANDGTLH